jgi:hypothetical protein
MTNATPFGPNSLGEHEALSATAGEVVLFEDILKWSEWNVTSYFHRVQQLLLGKKKINLIRFSRCEKRDIQHLLILQLFQNKKE